MTVKYEIYTNGKYDSPTAACAAYAQSWTGFTGAWEVERYDANQQFVADPNGDICAIDIHDGRYGSKVSRYPVSLPHQLHRRKCVDLPRQHLP